MLVENLLNASVSVSVLWAKHMSNQCSGQNFMTVHLVYIETTFLLVFSMSFKACQVKQGAQISPLFYYDTMTMGTCSIAGLSMFMLTTFMWNFSQPTYHLAILTKHDTATHHEQKGVPLALNCKVLSHLKYENCVC